MKHHTAHYSTMQNDSTHNILERMPQ
uniref:Uncharacterized protein n=1 Tax=Anguilla anguilla TaxID=7936 RepID=A0A0E9P5E8_ANGAN